MSAEILRRAAQELREDAGGHPVPEMPRAVAGFLEAIAHRQDHGSDLYWPHHEDLEWANQIARAYLGEQP